MKKVKYVKVKLSLKNSQEFNIVSIEKTFLFNIEEFKQCETIEEIRDQFLDIYNGEFTYDYLQIETYKSILDSENGKFIEHIGE